jgi:SnoaL-like domain
MTELILPEPIAAFFAADRINGDAVARCFLDDAIVIDEGRTHAGIDAVKAWRDEVGKKFTYTCEPFAVAKDGDTTVVTSHLAGNFPGSPVDLRYFFRLERGRIARLEVRP